MQSVLSAISSLRLILEMTLTDGILVKIELVGREGCHLCADAELILANVCQEYGVNHTALSIDDNPELADLYWERIPVLLIDGEVFDFWRVNEGRLRERLSGA